MKRKFSISFLGNRALFEMTLKALYGKGRKIKSSIKELEINLANYHSATEKVKKQEFAVCFDVINQAQHVVNYRIHPIF